MLSVRSQKKTKKKDRSPNTSRDKITPLSMADEVTSKTSKREKKSKKKAKTDHPSTKKAESGASQAIPERENDDSGDDIKKHKDKSKREKN